jgi:hypothetical protein
MKHRIIKVFKTPGQYDVKLYRMNSSLPSQQQDSVNCFAIEYGTHFSEYLNYAEACKELGECLMHALQCANKLD